MEVYNNEPPRQYSSESTVRPVQKPKSGWDGFGYFLGGIFLGGVVMTTATVLVAGKKMEQFSPASVSYVDVDGDTKSDIVVYRNNGLHDVFLQREMGGEVVYRSLKGELELLDSEAFAKRIRLKEDVESFLSGLKMKMFVDADQKKQTESRDSSSGIDWNR